MIIDVKLKKCMYYFLVLQDFSNDEGQLITTWEFLLYNRITDAYDDSRFFSDSNMAFAYFIDKTSDMIDN